MDRAALNAHPRRSPQIRLRTGTLPVDVTDVTVSDTYRSTAPGALPRPARGPAPQPNVTPAELETPDEIVARLERWVAAAAAEPSSVRQSPPPMSATAAPASPRTEDAPAVPTPTADAPRPPSKKRDDLLPSEPGWSAILNEDVTPLGLATVACVVTLLVFAGLGLRVGAGLSGTMLAISLVVGRNRDHSAMATRIIVGVSLGIAIACLS